MVRRLTPQPVALLNRMPVEYELCMSLGWLTRLRWVAGASVILGTAGARHLLGLGLNSLPLYGIGLLILLYNLAFTRWLTRITCDLTGSSTQAHTLARAQVAVDWLAMTGLMHFSGGIESPLILYFFFHTTLAAILLSVEDTYLFAGVAVLLVGGLTGLEAAGILPHHHVEGFLPLELYRMPLYAGGLLFFFASTVFVSAYLATRTTRRLRTRQDEIVKLGQDLERAYGRLESLYESVQVVGSTLQLKEVLDRLTRSTTEVMGVRGCTIRLLHETGTELCLESWYGLSEDYLQKGCLLVEQNPLVRQVLAGEVVAIPDIRNDDRLQYPAEAVAVGIRSTLTAPLQGRSRSLGILRVYCDDVGCFTEDDAQFLVTVARYGSIAIENAMAYEAVQNLEEAKRKFVLMVTHELRSPVSVVRSLLGTLGGGYAGPLSEVQAHIIERAARRSEFLQTLIDDLLDLAGGKTGLRTGWVAEPVDLCAIVDGVAERYRIPAEEKHIVFRLDRPEACLRVLANRDELDRAMTNLISNAVKYTPEGGAVTVTLGGEGAAIRLQVQDSGIGIPEEALPHLFEEFYRAPNARAQVKQGTGLGLVIAKDIVTRYGGTIRVDSGEDRGTTFTVLLPRAPDDVALASGTAIS
jgi:signal transduction histidine kinase